MPRKLTQITALALLLGAAPVAVQAAASNYWVNWTGAPASYPNDLGVGGLSYATSATGTLYDPNTAQFIDVTYTGEVVNLSEFGGFTDIFNYPDTYLGPTVTTLPPAGNYVVLTGFSGLTSTLTFSAPVTNLILAVASLGAATVPGSYNFDRTADVASEGQGAFSVFCGFCSTMSMVNPTTALGTEGNGIVQFSGTFTTLSWTVPDPEVYTIFNVGITDASLNGVPEPASLSLVAAGVVALAATRRGRSKTRATRGESAS